MRPGQNEANSAVESLARVPPFAPFPDTTKDAPERPRKLAPPSYTVHGMDACMVVVAVGRRTGTERAGTWAAWRAIFPRRNQGAVPRPRVQCRAAGSVADAPGWLAG